MLGLTEFEPSVAALKLAGTSEKYRGSYQAVEEIKPVRFSVRKNAALRLEVRVVLTPQAERVVQLETQTTRLWELLESRGRSHRSMILRQQSMKHSC
jgi:hypothetical protein